MPTLTAFAGSMTSAFFAAIWQGLLLAAATALCLRVLPALSAAARALVWLIVAVLAVLLQCAQRPAAQTSAFPAMLPLDTRWSLLFATLWLAASFVRAVQLATGAFELRRFVRTSIAIPAPDACVALLLESRRFESRPAQLCTSAEVDRPSVLGFFRPRILLPVGLLETLSPAELQQVLLHELEHLRRRDDWTNLLGRLALVAFPLNPVLLWLDRRLATERELACDDRVLEATGARKAYATCLAHLAEHTLVRRGVSLALGLVGIHTARPGRSELARRVARILSLPGRTLNPRASTALVALLIALTTGGSVELAHSPQLIHFTSPSAPLSASSTPKVGAHLLSVAYQPRRNASPFIRTEALLPMRPSAPKLPPVNRKQTPPVRAQYSRAAVRQNTLPSRPLVRLTSFQSQSPIHLTLTISRPNQFSYAAIPTNGGWIFVVLPAPVFPPVLTLEL